MLSSRPEYSAGWSTIQVNGLFDHGRDLFAVRQVHRHGDRGAATGTNSVDDVVERSGGAARVGSRRAMHATAYPASARARAVAAPTPGWPR
ncbi:hypothetical protein AB0J79_04890 [Rhodococcus coprophilus]|uniref:hypothetical protein n=1 Tax=Rhodococcus coprophilus TaxID=38310 RepID=UPI0034341B05